MNCRYCGAEVDEIGNGDVVWLSPDVCLDCFLMHEDPELEGPDLDDEDD